MVGLHPFQNGRLDTAKWTFATRLTYPGFTEAAVGDRLEGGIVVKEQADVARSKRAIDLDVPIRLLAVAGDIGVHNPAVAEPYLAENVTASLGDILIGHGDLPQTHKQSHKDRVVHLDGLQILGHDLP